MKFLLIILVLILTIGGCRFSISAEKLQLSGALDQTAYLSKEDPALYESESDDKRIPD